MPNYENLAPSGDGTQTTLNLTGAATHWQAVLTDDETSYVWNDTAFTRRDLYYHTNPTRQDEGIKKLAFITKVRGNNPLVWRKIAIRQNSTVYHSSSLTISGPWHLIALLYLTSPGTGLAWTIAEVNALEAGLQIYDSGIPSGGYCDQYIVRVIWENAKVQTNPATLYTGTTARLNGEVLEDEGDDCRVLFQWGETVAYGNVTAWQTGMRESDSFFADIGGLDPTKFYHFRAVIVSPFGETFYGNDQVLPRAGFGRNPIDVLVKSNLI